MIADKEFAGDDDHTTTAAGAMKGLSPYTMAGMTADEIVEANEYAQALEESRAATVTEIRKKHAQKAHAPSDFTDMLDIMKTYANLLQALFGRRCCLLKELVDDMILPLQKFKPIAKQLMAKTTLASIMWALFKQACQFTLGLMDENGEREAEWDTAVTMICSKSDFSLLEVPMSISGVPTVAVTTGKGKHKELDNMEGTPGDTTEADSSQL